MPLGDHRPRPRAAFLRDLFGQLSSDAARIDDGRCCAYNAFLGVLLIGGGLVLRLSGPPDPLGPRGFALVVASGVLLLTALVVPLARPRLVPAMLAAHGLLIVALAAGFASACVAWANGAPAARSFKYLPGLIVVAMTYGAALWADHGPVRGRPQPWRVGGFVVGIAIEAVVAGFVVAVALRG